MSNYWKKKLDELNQANEKTSSTKKTSSDYWKSKMDELEKEEERKKHQAAIDDIAPVKVTMQERPSSAYTTTSLAPALVSKQILDERMQRRENEATATDIFGKDTKKAQEERTVFKKSGVFEDGYDFGDVTRTILGTAGDAATGVAKGFVGSFEGITDLASYAVAGIADKAGAEDFAEDLKRVAQRSQTDKIFGGFEKAADTDSVLGDKADSFAGGIGQILSLIAGGAAAKAAGWGSKAITALITAMTGTSSMGSGMSEAYQGGATDEQAVAYGAAKGVIDAGTELIAGGLGKAINAVGISRGIGGIDDIAAKKLADVATKKIGNEFWKTTISNAAEYGVKAAAEGAEEVLAGYGTAIAKKATYMSDEEFKQILEDENLLEQFVMGALAGGTVSLPGAVDATVAGKDYVTGYTQSEQAVIDAEVQKRIAEAENNGEKPNKSKIYDDVVSDMEKGIINIDNNKTTPDKASSNDGAFFDGEDVARVQDSVQDLNDSVQDLNDVQKSAISLADIAKSARRAEMRGAYVQDGKQYISDGSFIAELNTVDESLEQREYFPIKRVQKELEEVYGRQIDGKYELDTSNITDGYIKVGDSLFDAKYVNAAVGAIENPEFSLSAVRGGDKALLVTGENGRVVLMPVRASENVKVAYEAQMIDDAVAPVPEAEQTTLEGFAPISEQDANALQSESIESLTDEDAPPEVEAPYYEDEAAEVANPFENRDMKAVSKDRKTHAYMYDNPEVKPFFQSEAKVLLRELEDGTKGEKIYTPTPDGQPGVYGAESYGVWHGIKRHVSADIAYLLDEVKMSYADIEKGLKAIIEDNGAENIAAAKKIEFVLNDRLLNGYQDWVFGMDIPPNQDYVNLINEKQIMTYADEARQQAFAPDNAFTDEMAPSFSDPEEYYASVMQEDVAPVAESAQTTPDKAYEAIRPPRENKEPSMKQAEPRMKRVDPEQAHKGGEKERSWYETSTGSEAVDGLVTPDDIPDEVRYYKVKPNRKTLAAANARLERDGYAKSREYFEGRMTERKLTVEDIALGERLIQEAAKAGDAAAVRDLIIDVSILGTELGQRVQALSIIRRLTPEGQLKALQRTVERGKAKGDKAFNGVEITQEMIDYILKTYGSDGTYIQSELDAAVEDVKQQIADQMKVGATDYINAWRYLSMLGNPKTHIRNVVSNIAMFGTRAVKNAIARTGEDILLRNKKPTLNTEKPKDIAPMRRIMPEGTKVKAADRDNIGTIKSFNAGTGKYTVYFQNKAGHNATVQLDANLLKPLNPVKTQKNGATDGDIAPVNARTKTWKWATDAVKSFAKQTTKEMESTIKGDTKYSEEGSIKEKRKIFKTRVGNALANANSFMLEWEDALFSKIAFKQTLQEYLTANGVKTEADIKNNPELVEAAKDYALEEARKATFRQDSYLANKIAEIEHKNAAYGVVVGSVMPFKKTPINIAKTGVAYSPLGFARSVYDYFQVRKGNMQMSEAIDHFAQAFTGASLTLIGFALAQAGVLNGAGEDDKEGKYDYQLGEQSYSFNFGGDTYSLSWLSPVAMPLFVGANAYEKLVEKEEWDANVVVDTLAQTLDPLSEMSFLSSLDDVLSSYDSGIEKIWGAGESMVQNYATQFIPTLSSQAAAWFDNTKRSTKASGTSGFEFGEETLNKIKYKIPGLRNTLEPTTDIWGNDAAQTENFFARGFEQFLSPANRRAGIATAVDEEIKELYRQTGDGGVIPSIPYDYINYDGVKYDMSAKEFTAYKHTYGQTAFDLMEQLFNTDTYKNATSEERADMVNKVYDYARDAAKLEYFKGLDVDYTNATEDGVEVFKENAIKGAIGADLPVDEYTFSRDYPAKYKFFKANGISYNDFKAADEDGKRAYTWAYENPGKYTMSKVISDDFLEYYGYRDAMNDFDAKDASGKTVSGLKKERVAEYINSLDLDYGQRILLYRSMFDSNEDKATYNYAIIEYLNSREDISYEQMVTILRELDMVISPDGTTVTW